MGDGMMTGEEFKTGEEKKPRIMRVVTVQVVEENISNPSERRVYRLSGEDAKKWMKAATEGIILLSGKADIRDHVSGKYDGLENIEWEERFKS